LQLAVFVEESICAFHISFGVFGLFLEGSITGFESDGVSAVLVDLVDVGDNHTRSGGGGRGHSGCGGVGRGAHRRLSLLLRG